MVLDLVVLPRVAVVLDLVVLPRVTVVLDLVVPPRLTVVLLTAAGASEARYPLNIKK